MKTSNRLVIASILSVCVLVSLNCSRSTPGGLSAVLGDEILISTNSESILKCEPAVAMTDKVIVVAWNDSYGGMNSGIIPGVVVGWAISMDKGKTFEFKGYLPAFEKKESFMAADSWFQTDSRGNIYLNILNWGPDKSEMYLYFMDGNNPGIWEKLGTPISVPQKVGIIDRPMMFLHEEGRLWISYTQVSREDRIKRIFDYAIVYVDGARRYKLGFPPDKTRGKIAYISKLPGGTYYLILKSFKISDDAVYIDKPYGDQRENGDVIQIYNHSEGGDMAFAEIETHTPAPFLAPGDQQSFKIDMLIKTGTEEEIFESMENIF